MAALKLTKSRCQFVHDVTFYHSSDGATPSFPRLFQATKHMTGERDGYPATTTKITAFEALFLTDVLQAQELVHPQVEVQVQKRHGTDLGGHLPLELGSGRGVHLDDHLLDGFVVDASDGEVLESSHLQARSHPLLLAMRQRAEALDDVALDPSHGLKPRMVVGVHG